MPKIELLNRFFNRTKQQEIKRIVPDFEVYVSTIAYRSFDPKAYRSLIQLLSCMNPKMIWGPHRGSTDISLARCVESTIFLDTKLNCSCILFLDDDISYDPRDIRKLCVECVQGGYDIIGAAYVLKQDRGNHLTTKIFDGDQIRFHKDSTPVEVRYLAGGCMCINRNALEIIVEKLENREVPYPIKRMDMGFGKIYPFFVPFPKVDENGINRYLTEDWAFTQNAREAGLKVWLDPSIRLGHNGKYTYELEDIIRPEKKHEEEIIYYEPDYLGNIKTEETKQI